MILVHAVHGLDVPYIRDNLAEQGMDKATVKNVIYEIVLRGVLDRGKQ